MEQAWWELEQRLVAALRRELLLQEQSRRQGLALFSLLKELTQPEVRRVWAGLPQAELREIQEALLVWELAQLAAFEVYLEASREQSQEPLRFEGLQAWPEGQELIQQELAWWRAEFRESLPGYRVWAPEELAWRGQFRERMKSSSLAPLPPEPLPLERSAPRWRSSLARLQHALRRAAPRRARRSP